MAERVLLVEHNFVLDLLVEPSDVGDVCELIVSARDKSGWHIVVLERYIGRLGLSVLLHVACDPVVESFHACLEYILAIVHYTLVTLSSWEIFEEDIKPIEVVD